MAKEIVIIDTDPGVDDCAAIALSLYDEFLDIKLITTVNGNVSLNMVTRNALHLLEKFGRTDIPVAKGAKKAMERTSPDASFIHQSDGMGGYKPPRTVKTKPIETDAVEAMYQTIKKYKNNISIVELGPHTNLGNLLTKHPDVIPMIDHIYTEGCAPYGWHGQGRWKHYRSFNASSDPEALQIVMQSGIPVTIVPSRMGRDLANFTEQEVEYIGKINAVGKFLYDMYNGYWEHGYTDKRIATNDTCAMLCLRYPELFKTVKVSVNVNTTDLPGRTDMKKDKNGHVELAVKVNRRKMHALFFEAVKKLDKLQLK